MEKVTLNELKGHYEAHYLKPDQFNELLEAYAKEVSQEQWINRSERLPKESGVYDIIMMNGKRETDVIFDIKAKGMDQWYKFKDGPQFPDFKTCFLFTHWKPIIKPNQ